MTSKLPPILFTSCVIVSDHSVALKDQESRIRLTLESLDKWLLISPDMRLVICDGSNFDFSSIVQDKFPNAKIECLYFQNNMELVRIHGKGFGEGEIVSFALEHSVFLKDADFYGKCTAKLWVENFLDCLAQWNGLFVCKGVFSDVFSFKKTQFSYIDTRFYLVNKSFYLKNLATAYLNVGGEQGLSLEDCFKDVIIKEHLSRVLFSIPPVICGVGGGSGKYYKNNLKRRIKEIVRLKLARQNFPELFTD
ncbi:MAG: hypothetical protein WCK93_05920 [Nitrosomonadales bacterium]